MKAGFIVPYVNFLSREGDAMPGEDLGGCPIGGRFVKKSSSDIFEKKRVVVFALPGAWTPTCSSQQLPGYEKLYDEFKSHGIDEVYCLSVNDGFVMNSWFHADGIKKVKPLCDGNAEFTRLMGMLVDKSNLGFGQRSWRYAMVVDDTMIEELFVEPDKSDNAMSDPYGESAPEKVLDYLKRESTMGWEGYSAE